MTWSDATVRWRTEMLAADQSPDTIRLRIYWLRRWERVCRHPQSATRDALVAFLARAGWAPETRRSVRASLVRFYTFMHTEGHMPDNPAVRLPKIRVPIPLPRPAPDDAIISGIASARPRVKLMIWLAAIGAMRRAEISRVHTSHLAGRTLRVFGKGGKVRTIDLPDWLARIIADHPEGWLFPAPSGDHLTPAHVGVLITRALPDGVTPHQLRHAAASELHEQGLSLEEIRIVLGHARLDTTQRYVAVKSARTAAAIERAGARFAS